MCESESEHGNFIRIYTDDLVSFLSGADSSSDLEVRSEFGTSQM